MSYFFKIHSGYQANACVPVDLQRNYIVGNKYGNDIFLCIDDVEEEEYCQFRIQNNNELIFIHFNPKLNFNLANGAPLKSEEVYTLPLFIEVSGIQFAIGQKDEIANWPQKPEANDGIDESNDAEPILEIFDDSDYPPELPAMESRPHSLLQSKLTVYYQYLYEKFTKVKVLINQFINQSKLNKIYAYSILALLILTFISSVIVWGVYRKTGVTTVEAKINNMQQIKQKYNKLPPQYSNLILAPLAEESFSLSGLVKNENEVLFINNYFADYQKQIKFNLINAQSSLKQINSIIDSAQVGNLAVRFDDSSRQISLKGFATNYINLDDAEISINTEFPNIGQIDVSRVFDVNEVNHDIKNILGNSFPDQITIEPDLDNSTIRLQGFLAKSDSVALGQKIDILKQKYPILIVKDEIKDISSALPFKIFSVYTGQPSYITTDGGLQVFEGGIIKGFKLQSIDTTKLVFSGKYQLVIPLSKLMNFSDPETSTQGPRSYNNLRTKVLTEEKIKIESAINSEENQLTNLNQYKNKVTDNQIKNFIGGLINNLQDDLAMKKNDLQQYAKAEQS